MTEYPRALEIMAKEAERLRAEVERLTRAWDAALELLARDEICVGADHKFYVICNDLFYPAADGELINADELCALRDRVKAEGWPAIVKWISEHRNGARALPEIEQEVLTIERLTRELEQARAAIDELVDPHVYAQAMDDLQQTRRERDDALADVINLSKRLDYMTRDRDAQSDALREVCRERDEAREDAKDSADHIERMSVLWTATANALKGDPPPLTLHSWHDLPDVAKTLHTRLAAWREVGALIDYWDGEQIVETGEVIMGNIEWLKLRAALAKAREVDK